MEPLPLDPLEDSAENRCQEKMSWSSKVSGSMIFAEPLQTRVMAARKVVVRIALQWLLSTRVGLRMKTVSGKTCECSSLSVLQSIPSHLSAVKVQLLQ